MKTILWSTLNNTSTPWMTDEDWFNLGKADAWEGKPKSPPAQDAQAASMYDLGYCEAGIQHRSIRNKQVKSNQLK